jgi:ubiquinone/menaquinone biosynthesis C-methylase UbiE
MATFLRDLSYRYSWFYNSIARLAAVSVGGEQRFRQLALEGVTIAPDMRVLDLCCGPGQATQVLVQQSHHVTGLDASPWAIQRAKRNVPQADYVEAFAEAMPFGDRQFDLVHTSVALHEMEATQLQQILQEVQRVLKPGGIFALVDFHAPTNPLFVPAIAVFLLLFETETAWALLRMDLAASLEDTGFRITRHKFYAGGSLQVIQAEKWANSEG